MDLHDRQTRELASRVAVHFDGELNKGYPDGRPVHVEITLSNGKKLVADEKMPFGDNGWPAPEPDWRAKLVSLIGEPAANDLISFVKRDPKAWKTDELGEAMQQDLGL